jgi:hypothetical protein
MVPVVPGGWDLAVKRVKAAIKRGDNDPETLVAEVANAFADFGDGIKEFVVSEQAMKLEGRVRAIHRPFNIYDDCGHKHEIGEPGVEEIDDIGLTCDLEYKICVECCTVGANEGTGQLYQTEDCISFHDHGKDKPICRTIAVLPEVLEAKW